MYQLKQYTDSLLSKGVQEKDIFLSTRIAKMITIELRNELPNSDQAYRDAVDRTQLQFKSEVLEKLFLIVSREFYHSWLGNIPNTLSVI